MTNLIVGLFGVFFFNLVIILGSLVLLWILGNLQSFLPTVITTPLLVIFSLAILAISITQLLYVIPWVIKLNRQNQLETAKGVTVGAIITALLNGSCWILVISML